MTDDLRIE